MVTPDDRGVEIRAQLRHLAEADRQLTPAPAVERRVLAAWDAHASRHSRQVVRREWVLASVGLAAVLVAFVVWSREPSGRDSFTSETPIAADSYLQWLDDDPSSLQIYRLRATPAALASLGMAVAELGADDMLEIELVVGADGARRGARLVPAAAREEF